MKINPTLIEVVNSKGMVVRSQTYGRLPYPSTSSLVVIEGAQYHITFDTAVFIGHNYFKIVEVQDLINNRTYKAQRYFYKFIALISSINGETHVALKK